MIPQPACTLHLQHRRSFKDIAHNGAGMKMQPSFLSGSKMYFMRLHGA